MLILSLIAAALMMFNKYLMGLIRHYKSNSHFKLCLFKLQRSKSCQWPINKNQSLFVL